MRGANKTWSLFRFPKLNPDCHCHDGDEEEDDDAGQFEDCDDDEDGEEEAEVPQPALDDVLLSGSELPSQLRLHCYQIQHLQVSEIFE